MAERKTYQKNIRFNEKDREESQKILDNRDRNKYPYEGDLYNHRLIEGDELVSVEDPYYLQKICSQRCLIKYGRYYFCSRGGSFKDVKSKVKRLYVFRTGTDPISIEGIKKICEGCFNCGDALEDKEIDEVCGQNKLIKEGDGFICTRGGPTEESRAKDGHPYKFEIDKHPLPLEIVIKMCNSACNYTHMHRW